MRKKFTSSLQGTLLNNRLIVSPQLLFQRFKIAARTKDDPKKAFEHELSNYPTAIFDSPGLLLEAQKSTLAEFIWTNFFY